MAIEEIPIRAEIWTGGQLLVKTPYIQNFSVNKNRGSHSTFSATIKIKSIDFAKITKDIVIWAGPKEYGTPPVNGVVKIFTGHIKKTTINPSWDDPSYLLVSLQGADILADLDDKGFTRRQTYSINSWAKIDSVVRSGSKSGKFKYIKEPAIMVSSGEFETSSSTFINTAPTDVSIAGPTPAGGGKDTSVRLNVTSTTTNDN